jgi:hypothetical protein
MALRPVLFISCYHYGHFYEVMTIHLKELFSIHFLLWLQIQEQNLLTHLSGIFPDHFSTFANQKKPLTPGEILLEDSGSFPDSHLHFFGVTSPLCNRCDLTYRFYFTISARINDILKIKFSGNFDLSDYETQFLAETADQF